MPRKSKSDGLRITRVGLWYVVFLAIVGVAAANTGNNGLFLVLAVMGGALLASEVAARWNVRGLEVGLRAPAEVFANSPSHLEVTVTSRGRWLTRWLLLVAVEPKHVDPPRHRPRTRTRPFLVPRLARRGVHRGRVELMTPRRGRRTVRFVHVTSLFPLGLFRKGRRYRTDVEVLVYPEIFTRSESRPAQLGRTGNEPTRRPGWGHELLGLRSFRHGDDPRGIHWKQTARTGDLIYKQRETEEVRRLMVVFDNAVGALESSSAEERFERLVSEAATAALDYLEDGYEVSLLTRDASLPFASGRRQRLLVLETLALIEPVPAAARPLEPRDAAAPYLRLAMEPEASAA